MYCQPVVIGASMLGFVHFYGLNVSLGSILGAYAHSYTQVGHICVKFSGIRTFALSQAAGGEVTQNNKLSTGLNPVNQLWYWAISFSELRLQAGFLAMVDLH